MGIWAALSNVLLEIWAFESGWEFQGYVNAEVIEVDAPKRICAFNLLKLLFELLYFIFCFFVDPSEHLLFILWGLVVFMLRYWVCHINLDGGCRRLLNLRGETFEMG